MRVYVCVYRDACSFLVDRSFRGKIICLVGGSMKKEKRKRRNEKREGGEEKEKEKEERTKIKRLQCVIGHWLSLKKIRKARNLWNLKSEYFFFLLLEILNRSVNICFHSSVCILFSFLSFFFYPRRIYKKTSRFAKNFTFIYSFLSLDEKLSDRRNIRKIEHGDRENFSR